MADVPVTFLSAYSQDEIIARAFDNGAADYVVKPFSPTELVARIRAALRKREAPEWAEPSEPYVFGDLTIDYAERRVTMGGRPVHLTAIEYGPLFELSANAGRVMTYDRLLQRRDKLGDDASNSPTSSTSPASAIGCQGGRRREQRNRECRACVLSVRGTPRPTGRGGAPNYIASLNLKVKVLDSVQDGGLSRGGTLESILCTWLS